MKEKSEIKAEHISRIRAVLDPAGIQVNEYEYIITGANSAVYKLTCSGGQQPLVAKVGVQPSFKFLDQEYKMLKLLRGLAPEPLYFGVDKASGLQVLVESFVDGIHPFSDFDRHLEKMAETVTGYHSVEPPEGMLVQEDWRTFCEKRIMGVEAVRNPLVSRFQETLEAVLKIAETDSFSRAGEETGAVIVHGDLIPNNMIIDETDRLYIIDWEGARLDDAEADLATLIKGYRLQGESLQRFMGAYGRPIDSGMLWLRAILHYLQVVAWRLKCQIPGSTGEAQAGFQKEAEEEVDFVERALEQEDFQLK